MLTLTQEQKNQLTEIMQREVDAGRAIGSALCILKDGEELYRGNFGYADKANLVPITDDTIYRIFSMSKPITSVAVLILAEQGLLSLDEPLSKYLPAFAQQEYLLGDGTTAKTPVPVTIRHLMNMTAGLYYPGEWSECGKLNCKVGDCFLEAFRSGHPLNTIELVNKMAEIPLGFVPGTHWNYGTCADVLGAVVEVVSGQKFSDFLREKIWAPLGMTDTDFYVPEEKLARYSKMYDRNPDGSLFEHEVHLLGLVDRNLKNPFESGGAGMVSTVTDYARFAAMLANEGEFNGHRILKPETVRMMHTPTLPEHTLPDLDWESLKGYSYSNLVRILTNPEENGYAGTVGEFGWDGWTGNYFYVDPVNRLVFLYFVQICGGTNPALMRELSRVIYGE